jgi:hypothetical protein
MVKSQSGVARGTTVPCLEFLLYKPPAGGEGSVARGGALGQRSHAEPWVEAPDTGKTPDGGDGSGVVPWRSSIHFQM